MKKREVSPSPASAIAEQRRLSHAVDPRWRGPDPETIGGIDVSIRRGFAIAAVVVMTFRRLEIIDSTTAIVPVSFPYVPGLLAYREMPAIRPALRSLRRWPDLFLVDGQGIAHPRRFGLAAHVGVEFDVSSIGVGKTRFIGEHKEPGERRGCCVQLRHDGEVIGSVVRTRQAVKPVYVSIGHRIDLATAVRFVLRSARRYRLPEPIRAAHRLAGAVDLPAPSS